MRAVAGMLGPAKVRDRRARRGGAGRRAQVARSRGRTGFFLFRFRFTFQGATSRHRQQTARIGSYSTYTRHTRQQVHAGSAGSGLPAAHGLLRLAWVSQSVTHSFTHPLAHVDQLPPPQRRCSQSPVPHSHRARARARACVCVCVHPHTLYSPTRTSTSTN